MTPAEVASQVREALIRDGYDDPPAVGSVFRDDGITWLDEGVAVFVLLTAIGPTVNGWQVRLFCWHQRADEPLRPVRGGAPGGILYLDHLLGRQFPEIFRYTRVADGDWDPERKTWHERKRVTR